MTIFIVNCGAFDALYIVLSLLWIADYFEAVKVVVVLFSYCVTIFGE